MNLTHDLKQAFYSVKHFRGNQILVLLGLEFLTGPDFTAFSSTQRSSPPHDSPSPDRV